MELFYIKNGIHNFDEISDEEKAFLPYYEINKIGSLKQDKNRTLHFLSKWLLYEFMKEKGYSTSMLRKISYDRFQKPFLYDFPFHFSFSHSGDIAVLAVSPKNKIGIDIEEIPTNKLSVVPDIFSNQEKEISQHSSDLTNYFFYVWTAKESIMKAWGKGFDSNFKEINIEAEQIRWQNSNWFLKSCPIDEKYICHVASDNSFENVSIQEMKYN